MKRTPIKPISKKRRARLAAYLEVRREVLTRDRWRCLVCSKPAVDTHHILYRSQGGPDEAWNLISLCRTCHDLAHAQGPSIWRETLYKKVEAQQRWLDASASS